MERALLSIRLQDKVKSETIREKTMFEDIGKRIAMNKWPWARHIGILSGICVLSLIMLILPSRQDTLK